MSGSLTDALSPVEAADLVERKALAALGATSAVVVTLGAFPPPPELLPPSAGESDARLHVVHAIGGLAELTAALEAQPLDAPLPFAEVARSGEPLFLNAAQALARFPDWGAGLVRTGGQAAAIVPVWANGELRGVLGLSWSDARTFDEDERAFVTTLGVMCAQAIMRAHLKVAEREARERAESANRSKAEFVATISHELRTPISAVLNYVELLAGELTGPALVSQLARVERMRLSGGHLLALLDELLLHARVEAVHATVKPERVALQAIVDESLALVRPIAEARGLTVQVEMPPEVITVYTDALKLRQIVVNLVANAVRHARHGEVHVIVRLDGIGEIRIRLIVKDDGDGVAREDRERIFQPFWQKVRDPVPHGAESHSGLGLSVARDLARLLGGELGLEDAERTSTFILSIPAEYRTEA
ncbi:MAG: GAF domain-containing sensor histidine kinase [Gemmatimonadaceae bacterium]|nr:GAF domain-containing sensor histidine kinase [Gemmatimonadaceae bacterium]